MTTPSTLPPVLDTHATLTASRLREFFLSRRFYETPSRPSADVWSGSLPALLDTLPTAPGVFSLTHNTLLDVGVFGTLRVMRQYQEDLLQAFGFGRAGRFAGGRYDDVAAHYDATDVDEALIRRLGETHGPVFFLGYRPVSQAPAVAACADGVAKTMDVLVDGETVMTAAELAVAPNMLPRCVGRLDLTRLVAARPPVLSAA
jgi:hypothetical protein